MVAATILDMKRLVTKVRAWRFPLDMKSHIMYIRIYILCIIYIYIFYWEITQQKYMRATEMWTCLCPRYDVSLRRDLGLASTFVFINGNQGRKKKTESKELCHDGYILPKLTCQPRDMFWSRMNWKQFKRHLKF